MLFAKTSARYGAPKGCVRVTKNQQLVSFTFGLGGYYNTQDEAEKAALEWIEKRKDNDLVKIEIVLE